MPIRRNTPVAIDERFPIVCIGMSSGGLGPVKEVFRNINPTTGMAFIIIHHLNTIPTLLPGIISKCTTMPVLLAKQGLKIEPNQVYILPSGREVETMDSYFSARPRSKLSGFANVFTILLKSLTKSRHPGIAVILSGLDADGAASLRMFKESGGVTIVQSPESAERPDMPQAAISTGCISYVLPPELIAAQLEKTGQRLIAPMKV